MSNSTTNLDLVQSTQAYKEAVANALFDAASPAMLWGRRSSTTSGLTWGYYGGNFIDNTATAHAISNGTVTLTASTTNYVYADNVTGAVSVNTTGVPAGKVPLYTVVTGSSGVNSYTDNRSYQPSVTGGSVTSVANEGSGVGLYDTIVAGVAKFKSLVQGTGITITDNGNGTVTIATSGSATGTVTGGANEGSGVGVFDAVNSTSATLKYKSLVAGANITLTDGGTAGITVAAGSSVSGAPNVQQNGTGVVTGASVLNFVGGATVTNPSGSQANISFPSAFGASDTIPPNTSTFTAASGGAGTLATTNNSWGFDMYKAGSGGGDNWSILYQAVPSTPYQVVARLRALPVVGNYQMCGLVWYDTASAKMEYFGLLYSSGLFLRWSRWNSLTSYSNNVFGDISIPFPPEWFRIRDDGTSRYADISPDGVTWVNLGSKSRTDFITPTSVGVGIDPEAPGPLCMSVHSWYAGV